MEKASAVKSRVTNVGNVDKCVLVFIVYLERFRLSEFRTLGYKHKKAWNLVVCSTF